MVKRSSTEATFSFTPVSQRFTKVTMTEKQKLHNRSHRPLPSLRSSISTRANIDQRKSERSAPHIVKNKSFFLLTSFVLLLLFLHSVSAFEDDTKGVLYFSNSANILPSPQQQTTSTESTWLKEMTPAQEEEQHTYHQQRRREEVQNTIKDSSPFHHHHHMSHSSSVHYQDDSSPAPTTTPFCQGVPMVMFMDGFRRSLITNSDRSNRSMLSDNNSAPPCLNYLVGSWQLDNRDKFCGAMVYSFLLALLLEGLSAARLNFMRTWPKDKQWILRAGTLTTIYAAQALLGYLIMFVAMMYSVELLISVACGLAVGNGLFFTPLETIGMGSSRSSTRRRARPEVEEEQPAEAAEVHQA